MPLGLAWAWGHSHSSGTWSSSETRLGTFTRWQGWHSAIRAQKS